MFVWARFSPVPRLTWVNMFPRGALLWTGSATHSRAIAPVLRHFVCSVEFPVPDDSKAFCSKHVRYATANVWGACSIRTATKAVELSCVKGRSEARTTPLTTPLTLNTPPLPCPSLSPGQTDVTCWCDIVARTILRSFVHRACCMRVSPKSISPTSWP